VILAADPSPFTSGIGLVVTALAGITALITVATVLGFGWQQGRVRRLNEELSEETRRRTRLADDLTAAEAERNRDRDVIAHLQGEVAVMREVFSAVSGPIAALTAATNSNHELLGVHHSEVVDYLEELQPVLLDLRHLLVTGQTVGEAADPDRRPTVRPGNPRRRPADGR
jgi:predicted nuclease with TOPRIM domain